MLAERLVTVTDAVAGPAMARVGLTISVRLMVFVFSPAVVLVT